MFPHDIFHLISVNVSTITTFLIIVVSLHTKLYKEPFGNMVLWIMVADLLFSATKGIGMISGPSSTRIGCQIISTSSDIGVLASYFWSASFAHALFNIILYQDLTAISKNRRLYNLIVVISSIVIGVSGCLMGRVQISSKTGECVHAINSALDYSFWLVIGVPVFISTVLSIFWCSRAILRLKKSFAQAHWREILLLLLYPVILIFSWGPITVAAFLNLLGVPLTTDLLLAFNVTCRLQGFLDAIVYGCSKRFRQEVKNIFTGFGASKKPKTNLEVEKIPTPLLISANNTDSYSNASFDQKSRRESYY